MEIFKFMETSRILSHSMFVLELSMVMLWDSLEYFTECCMCNYDVVLQK